MNFRDYEWYQNPRGLHNQGAYAPFRLDHFTDPQMGWAKMVAGGREYITAVEQMVVRGITPIMRYFRERFGAGAMPEDWYEAARDYITAGCRWFEFYNEPNLEIEWPTDGSGNTLVPVDWQNRDTCIAPLMENWLNWAERVIHMGAYPAFPAMSETTTPRGATTMWLDACLQYLRDVRYDRMRNVIGNGLWCATHPYVLNHFYQEPPGGPRHAARPYYQQAANEPGWHFEYPLDPLGQRIDPGRTVFGNTPLTPYGDPNGLLASGYAFLSLLRRYFQMGPVPVVGTEGGIWPIPSAGGETLQQDTRYPPVSYESHVEATMAMFRWVAEQGPPWFWGVALWIENDYFAESAINPVIARMAAEAPILKEVADIDTTSGIAVSMGGEQPRTPRQPQPSPLTGPGPLVEGSPDYHWVILAPGLQADWFFLAARRYWQTFRPTILPDWDLIRTLPYSKTLAVTVLARSDTIHYMNRRVRDRWPNVFYDPIVFDRMEDMQAELDRRATYQRRFG